MKFTDVVLVFVVVISLYLMFLAEITNCLEIEEKVWELEQKNSCKQFVSESFRKICEGETGFEDFNEWQEVCRAMFNLKYIGWSNACDFMQVSYENSVNELFYGKWISNEDEGEVYCRMRKK